MPVEDIFQAVLNYDMKGIADIVEAELDAETEIDSILNQGLIAPMDEVGRRFSEGDLFIPEMLRAAKTMQSGLEVLKPHLIRTDSQNRGIVVMGTVQGDMHDVGKNLVTIMLEGGGFKVVDIGIDVEPRKFIDAVKEHDAKVVGLSALLTTTMPALGETIAVLKEEIPDIRIMVGGAPVTQSFADKIGADGYSEDAAGAVTLARELMAPIEP